jgi:hypothetical protein
MGARQLRKIQLGQEVTPGTGVAATTIWRGGGSIKDESEIAFANEDVGVLGGVDRTYKPFIGSTIQFAPTEATFEQLPYILSAGIKNVVSGSADGAGTDMIYTYPMSSTSQNTIKSYTIQGGDNSGAERMLYSYVENFTLEGQAFKSLMMSATWKGRGSAPNAFTAALTPPAVTTIPFGTGKLYLDAIGGTIGSTQVSSILRSMKLNFKTGIEPISSVENLYFTSHAIVDPKITGDLVFYLDTSSIAEKANWLAETARLMKLIWEGPTVGTPGSTYSKKSLILNFYGLKWLKFSELQEDNGHDVVTASFEARYDVTSADYFTAIVVNELASLP